MSPKTDLSRLLDDDDDLAPSPEGFSWQTHQASGWHYLQTPNGIAVIHVEGGLAAGMVRFTDRTIMPVSSGGVKDVFTRAEGMLREGQSAWAKLEMDIFDPDEGVAEPRTPEAVAPPERREPPAQHGPTSAFRWKF